MGRVTGGQRSTKQPGPASLLMSWEANYQHRIEEFFKAPQDVSSTFQGTASSTLSYGSETVSQKDVKTATMNSLVIHETNNLKDYSGLEVMEEGQDQCSRNCEKVTCGSHSSISDDGEVKLPSKTDVSVQLIGLPNSPANEQEAAAAAAAGSGEPALGPLTSLQQKLVQLEVAFSLDVKQSTIVLKTIKYSIHYNLDELFKYAFSPEKVSLKQRLMSK